MEGVVWGLKGGGLWDYEICLYLDQYPHCFSLDVMLILGFVLSMSVNIHNVSFDVIL